MWPLLNNSPYQTSNIATVSILGCVPAAVGNSSAAWPTANKIIYQPFRIPFPLTIRQIMCHNGAAVSGNLQVGIYSANGVRLVTSGTVVQAGTNANQVIDITDTLVGFGVFYLALTFDNTISTNNRYPLPVGMTRLCGVLSETPGAFGLPAIATFAAAADAYIPSCALSTIAITP